MADTYTPLLRLTKPGLTTAGWGTLVNNGTFQLIDNAIAGIVDVDVSAGDVTLTTANGATDQARYMCLRVINGPVSARNVIVPTLNKIYFVINEGAGPIQIRTATGVALAIMPAGSSTVVRVDTSGDVYHAISQLQGLRLIDPLVPTSGGTGLASYAVGDLLYASSTTALSKLPIGATNSILAVSGGIPQWSSATSILQLLHPVGSIYINATNATNPGTLFGFGTWVAFGAGRVPVGFDSTNVLFDTAEETGGSADAVVVSHTHTITDPGHSHTTTIPNSATGNNREALYSTDAGVNTVITSSTATTGISMNTAGSSGTNANYQPYITVYMWKRTA
jgi:hypothetical protein